MRAAPALLLLSVLAACDDPTPREPRAEAPPAQATTDRTMAALRVAEERLRARFRPDEPFVTRAVRVHRQQLPDTLAVCGQANPSGRGSAAWIPYVAIVGFDDTRPAHVEFHFAGTTAEATRVYFELVDRCFDGGGPPAGRAIARPLPPAPLGLPSHAGDSAPRAAMVPPVPTQPPVMSGMSAPAAAVSGPMYGAVTTSQRSPVNLRTAPGGPVIGTIPRGTTLQVFDMAPGGWFLVGEAEPAGWVHVSGLER